MTKQLTAGELARLFNGELKGDSAITIDHVESLDNATPTAITFLGNDKYKKMVPQSKAGVILLPRDFEGNPAEETAWIFVDSPNEAFTQAVLEFAPPAYVPTPGIHRSAVIADTAELGQNVHVGPNAIICDNTVIGNNTCIEAGTYVGPNITIGVDCRIHPNVSLREGALIGNRVTIHCNTVIGSDGFGYEPSVEGHKKVPQVGIVQIDDDVEIGSCVTIDRARFGKTWLQRDAKIDILCQIAHNVVIGEGSFLMAQVGIAGSATIGKFVALYGQSAIPGHSHMGDFSKVLAKAGVISDLEPGSVVVGYPALDRKEFFRVTAATRRLPDALKRMKKMEKELASLREQLEGK